MADWGTNAKDRDRDRAIKLVEAASARGLIVDADMRHRIDAINAATTVGEIDLITRGLQGQLTPQADPSPDAWALSSAPADPTTSPTHSMSGAMSVGSPYEPSSIEYGEPLGVASPDGSPVKASPTAAKVRGCLLVFIAVLTLGIGGFIAAVVTIVGDGVDEITSGVDAPDIDVPGGPDDVPTVDLFTAAGLTDLTDAIDEKHGSTEVFEAVLQQEYAVVRVPAEASGQREVAYTWRGSLDELTRGTSGYSGRIDLRKVRADVLKKLLNVAKKQVRDANSSYAIVRAPGPGDEGAAIFAYAANEYSEGGYVSARLDGKVVRRVTW